MHKNASSRNMKLLKLSESLKNDAEADAGKEASLADAYRTKVRTKLAAADSILRARVWNTREYCGG